MTEAQKYLEELGFDFYNQKEPEVFNEDDKSFYTLSDLMEAYHQSKVNNFILPDVIKRFTYKQPVVWGDNLFYVTEDHGLPHVKVTDKKEGVPDFTQEYKVLRSKLTAL